MFISKKKLDLKVREAKLEAHREEWKSQQEIDLDERLRKIEKDIKKLKKAVKNGW